MWYSFSKDDMTLLMDFLRHDEWRHVMLSSQFTVDLETIDKEHLLVYRDDRTAPVSAVIYLDSHNRLFFSDLNGTDTAKYLTCCQQVRRWGRPYCLIGEPEVVHFFRAVYQSTDGVEVDYNLMTCHALSNACLCGAWPLGLDYVMSQPEHFESLKSLEIGYQQEEVIVSPRYAVANKVLEQLYRKRLGKETAFHLAADGKALAKAALSSRGFLYDQLGGVYTLKALRGNHLAYFLLRRMMSSVFANGRGISLFVKKQNQAADTLYKSLGFKERKSYRIYYL